MTKVGGSESKSGSITQRHGSMDPDPDPHQNVIDPQHYFHNYSVNKKSANSYKILHNSVFKLVSANKKFTNRKSHLQKARKSN